MGIKKELGFLCYWISDGIEWLGDRLAVGRKKELFPIARTPMPEHFKAVAETEAEEKALRDGPAPPCGFCGGGGCDFCTGRPITNEDPGGGDV